jgi:hypothetical protein
MANTYKVLGQSAPSATTATTLYTVPSETEAIISTISICNRGSSAGTYRVSIRPTGASQANQHYIVFDTSCAAKDSVMLTLGISLSAADVITVYASTSDFSFNAFGLEMS